MHPCRQVLQYSYKRSTVRSTRVRAPPAGPTVAVHQGSRLGLPGRLRLRLLLLLLLQVALPPW